MKKRSLIVLSLLLARIAVFQSGCDQERFSGGRVKNPASQREARPGTDLPQKKQRRVAWLLQPGMVS